MKEKAQKNDFLFTGSEWTFSMLEEVLFACEKIGKEELGLELMRNQVELITSDQMLEAYTSHGMPIHYHHWSNGKKYLQQKQAYKGGHMGLAYEIVINSDPCIAYCMEENSAAMQALVLAHASVGHNSVFNMNYLFKHWTDASAIVDYLIFARTYIRQCEERYGLDEVEEILDSAHALAALSFDRRKRQGALSEEQQQKRHAELLEALERERSQFDDLIPTDNRKDDEEAAAERGELLEPEENILYFLEKNAPNLKKWQREILRIVRTIQQYFYPQMQTPVVNEGWATFTHHYILNRLFEMGKITEGALLECMTSHTQVLYQRPMDPNLNPYALGFAIYKDIQRMCENPTDEDREWFPDLVGKDWKEECKFAMMNFKDESFILQYLSPKVMRDFRMFALTDDSDEDHYEVSQIHNEPGYTKIRTMLSEQYRLENRIPNMMVTKADMKGNRLLTVQNRTQKKVLLHDDMAKESVQHLAYLWGYDVRVETVDENGKVLQYYTAEVEN
jgi:stage V sporulation protein R